MSDGRLMMDLMRAFYWLDEGLQAALEARGWGRFSRSKSFTLANVALGVQRPSDIARNLGISRQAVSAMLREMVDEGLVRLDPDPSDGRAVIVQFNEKSRNLRSDALMSLDELEAAICDRIGTTAFAALRKAVARNWGEVPVVAARRAAEAAAEAAAADSRLAESATG